MTIRQLDSLDDQAAIAEATRLSKVARARWEKEAGLFGLALLPPREAGPSSFELGMLSLFRYARGEDVPRPLVESFIDDLQVLLFAGLASGVLAIPSWRRMSSRPWSNAWRLAELRLALEGDEDIPLDTLSQLLCVPKEGLLHILNGARERLSPEEAQSLIEALYQSHSDP